MFGWKIGSLCTALKLVQIQTSLGTPVLLEPVRGEGGREGGREGGKEGGRGEGGREGRGREGKEKEKDRRKVERREDN